MAAVAADRPLLERLPGPTRRVAVVRASRIGDFLCAVPALRSFRAALPDAEITLIGLPFVQPLAERSPYVDCFEEFPGFPGMADQLFDARQALAFLARMQAREFDLALQMHGSGVYSNTFVLLLGAQTTAGFVRPGDPAGRLAAALPFPDRGHESARLLALATYLGGPDLGLAGEFPLWAEDSAAAEQLLAGLARPLIGLHPGAREATKRWDTGRFAQAGLALAQAVGGSLVLLGGSDEKELAVEVARSVAQTSARPPACLVLAGQTSLGALGAIIARLAVLLTNDSGPAHVAYALGTPTVTVFGATDPARWGPPPGPQYRVLVNPVPCWPCDYRECPVGYQCLAGITVEQVVAAAHEVLRA